MIHRFNNNGSPGNTVSNQHRIPKTLYRGLIYLKRYHEIGCAVQMAEIQLVDF